MVDNISLSVLFLQQEDDYCSALKAAYYHVESMDRVYNFIKVINSQGFLYKDSSNKCYLLSDVTELTEDVTWIPPIQITCIHIRRKDSDGYNNHPKQN